MISICIVTYLQSQELSIPGYECSDCHGTGGWDELLLGNFSHATTNFHLEGVHQTVNCSDCHSGNTVSEKHAFSNVSSSCNSCHLDVHKNNLGDQCSQCHTSMSWIVDQRKFNHEETRFSLMGAHRFVNCNACHNDLTSIENTPTDCYSCHFDEFNNTQNPNHKSVNFDINCSSCHSLFQATWTASFNHDLTLFPLKGAHESEDCISCHKNNIYDLSLDCEGCHSLSGLAQTDYSISSYNHVSHNINDFCSSCHTTSSWQQLIFSHSTFSSESCLQCHAPEYATSIDPPHANENIGTDCQLCHSTENWSDETFTHTLEQTNFLLHGLHMIVDCQSCHVNNVFSGTAVTCESSGCHLATYESTSDPIHIDFGYPITYCEECHNTNGWQPIIFSHQLSLACMTCHMIDYNEADNPIHDETAGFSANCEDCHVSTSTWEGATFSHEGITNGCNQCHIDDYNTTTDPDHEAWGYPNTCEECHMSTTDWSDASFSHLFPIAPKGHQDETTETCISCHVDGNVDSFTCFGAGCHSVADMVDEHCEDGPNDCESCNGLTFPYSGVTSEDCYACHPNGNEDDCDGGDRHLKNKNKFYWRNKFLPG